MSIRERLQHLWALAVAGVVIVACTAPAPGTDQPGAVAEGVGTEAGLAAADRAIAEWVDAERIPGAVLLVSRDGGTIFERAYGHAALYRYGTGEYGAAAAGEIRADALRRLEQPVPMRSDTVFDLASVTKVMATTFAVMLLVDDGVLELDAPVRRYLPDFGGEAGGMVSGDDTGAGADITIRQLLTHRSGLSQWQPIYYSADDAAGAYAFIREFPLAWEPGAERHYSDLGFMLLGVLVERVSGQSLGEFLDRRLYGPLGLTAIGFRGRVGPVAERTTTAPGDAAAASPEATAAPRTPAARASDRFAATSHGNPFEHRMVHDPDFGYRIDIDPDSWDGWRRYTLIGEVNDGNAFHAFGGAAGHAGLFSTAADLGVLLQLLLNGGELDDTRYLSAPLVDEFLTDTGDNQALGWQVPDYLPEGSFHHTGFTGTYVAGIPSENIAVVLLTNRQNVGVDDDGRYPDVGELQRAVARTITGADSR